MSSDVIKHIPALRVYSRALCKTIPDADRLVEAAVLQAIECAGQYRSGENMRGWLFTVMRRQFIDDSIRHDPPDPAPVLRSVNGEEWPPAFRDLPREDREAIILVGVLGESHPDAAGIMGCTVRDIETRVERARAILRQALGDDERIVPGDPGRN